MRCKIQLLEREEEKTKNVIAGVLRQAVHTIGHGSLTMKQGPESLFIHLFDGMRSDCEPRTTLMKYETTRKNTSTSTMAMLKQFLQESPS